VAEISGHLWVNTWVCNGIHPGLRKAIIETVGSIAGQGDGMRCDMAMLLMTSGVWEHRAWPRPEKEYRPEVIRGCGNAALMWHCRI